MINTDFAPLENFSDSLCSLQTLFKPWKWQNGKEQNQVKEAIGKLINAKSDDLYTFFTARSALYHILKFLDLPSQSDILVTGFTCGAVVLPIKELCHNPIYIDIEDETFSMRLSDLQSKITKKSKVIILQHTFGIPPHRKQIIEIARENNLIVIEDLAHGFANEIFANENDKNQTIKIISFGRSKSISSVFGGIAFVPNQKFALYSKLKQTDTYLIMALLLYKPLAVLIKNIRPHFLGKIIHKICIFSKIFIPEISKKEKKGFYDKFFDSTYPNALACLLLHQMKRFKIIQKEKLIISEIYNEAFDKKIKGSCIRYPLLVKDRKLCEKELKKYNITVGNWYTQPVAPSQLSLLSIDYKIGTCPSSEHICNHIINLPTNISYDKAKDIAEIVREHLLN